MSAPRAQHEPAQPDPAPFDITAYPDDFLECREGTHPWPVNRNRAWRIASVAVDGHPTELSRVAMCPVCHTIRREVIDVGTGVKQRSTYRHPVGYRVPKGTKKTKRDFRVEMVRRVIDTITEYEDES